MADIGWIDFSQSDREKVGTILEQLIPEGVVDELGIGIIRDAIADQVFPGISTIMTRAKYFFIIPYILSEYQYLSPNQKKSKTVFKYLDDCEHEIMWELAERYSLGDGVIGFKKKKPKRLMRRPSEIYWHGLSRFKLVDTHGYGIKSFLKMCSDNSIEGLISQLNQSDDGLNDDADAGHNNIFHIKIHYDPCWREELKLALKYDEADLLRQKIHHTCKDLLISEILKSEKLKKLFFSSTDFMSFAKTAVNLPGINQFVSKALVYAHDFSELLYGAHIVYNMLLQEAKYKKEHFKDYWEDWKENLNLTMLDFPNFNPHILFVEPYAVSTKLFTRQFILAFWDKIKTGNDTIDSFTDLITAQEKYNKGTKARLAWKKYDDIKENKWIGLRRLEYRFRQAKAIISDINEGLRQYD